MVGFGYDIHRLAENETFILGGIKIEYELGTVAHSDGDVVLHSLIDALIGAAALGDIGEHFPDNDMKYKNIDSAVLLKKTIELLEQNYFAIENVDITIVLQKPKLSPYKDAIKNNIAKLCKLEAKRVNVKAKTSENLGFIGRSEGVACYSVCLVSEKK